MIVDNFSLISSYLIFEKPEDFYFLSIIQRKKDNVHNLKCNSNYRTIRNYYIRSNEELLQCKDHIIDLCVQNNARAYIWLNRRNTVRVSWKVVEDFIELIKTNNTKQAFNVFDRACCMTRDNTVESQWLVDIDDINILKEIKAVITDCEPYEDKILLEVPTVHGCHLITHPFNTKVFYEICDYNQIPRVDIHKDNPTLLFYETL